MQSTKILKVVSRERAFSSQLGGSIDFGLLSENHHKVSFIIGNDLLLNEDVVPLLWNFFYTASLSR